MLEQGQADWQASRQEGGMGLAGWHVRKHMDTHARTHATTCVLVSSWTMKTRREKCLCYRQKDRPTDGRTDARMEGWMDGWMDGGMVSESVSQCRTHTSAYT